METTLSQGRAQEAQAGLTKFLAGHPGDADALNLLARAQIRLGRREEGAALLENCLQSAPDFALARYNYANLLFKLGKFDDALAQLDILLAGDATNPLYRQMKGDVLLSTGQGGETLELFRALADENPGRAECWVNFGHALRAAGLRQESTQAYRKALECRPSYGLAYWSIANLKAVDFRDDEMQAMQAELEKSDATATDRVYIGFALGKGFEDRKRFEKSFEHYARANALMRAQLRYDPEANSGLVAESKALFTRSFFKARSQAGSRAADPIFVLSLPRSGSTLVEQILSSHPEIEGAGELSDIQTLSRRLAGRSGGYPRCLADFDPAQFTAMGEAYLESTRVHRKLGRSFFVDKKPANLHHIGLIHLIFPNAKIVDVRRHPAACCLSGFKSHFTTARPNLAEFGRFYRDYVELLAHFDAVLPGRIHRVFYENLVADPEAEVRKLLAYLGLPFDEACLRFHENRRSVLTPSSEQVRRPISAEGVEHWRNYEPWLGALLKSLGTALTAYPDVPPELKS